MKKILVVLLALVLVGGMFAQATVNGYVRTKAIVNKSAELSYVGRLRLNLNFTSEDKNVTMFTRLEANTITSGSAAPVIKYTNGSVKLMDGMLKITGGLMSTYDYSIGSGVSDYILGNTFNNYDLDSSIAMLFQLYPAAGLDIGLVIYPKATATAIGADSFGVNAVYSIEGMGKVVISSKLASAIDQSSVTASFQYTGMEGMDVAVGYKGLASTQIYALANYSTGPISIQIAPQYDLTASQLYLEGCVGYAVSDAVKANVLFAYDTTKATLGSSYLAALELNYTAGKFSALTGFYYDDVNSISIPLVVKYSF